jgi:hypothetical protein
MFTLKKGLPAMKLSFFVLTLLSALPLSYTCAEQKNHVVSTPVFQSANIVGYRKYELPPGGRPLFIGIGVASGTGADPTLYGLFGPNQLRTGETFASADKVYLWDAKKEQFSAYAQAKDHWFYRADRWGIQPENPVVPRGTGIAIVSAPDSTKPRHITISGDVIFTPPENPVKADKKSTMLLLSALPSQTDLNELTKRYQPHPGDNIARWNKGSYSQYTLQPDGAWKDGNGKTITAIDPGDAFWLMKKSEPHPQENL